MRLRITVEDESYDVEVEVLPEAEDDDSAADPGFLLPEAFLRAPPPSDALPGDHLCRSPIAGVVIAVAVAAGQQVRKDDPVLVIEAMKMQSTIGAPASGIVQSVNVAPGEKVKAGQVLVELALKAAAARQS